MSTTYNIYTVPNKNSAEAFVAKANSNIAQIATQIHPESGFVFADQGVEGQTIALFASAGQLWTLTTDPSGNVVGPSAV